MELLKVSNLHTYYGPVHALRGILFTVKEGVICAILGRNGAGKTTTLKSILGLVKPKSGSINFKGIELRGLPTHKIVKYGIGYSPEDRQIFPDLTVQENLEMGLGNHKTKAEDMKAVYEIFPELQALRNRKGLYLSGGQQKMLAIARSIIGKPELVLLDEPFEGLSPGLARKFISNVKKIREMGISILLAESNIRYALEVADRLYVLERGEIIFEGGVNEFRKVEERLRKAII